MVDFGVRYAKLFEIYNSTRLQKRRCDKTIFPRSLRNIYQGNLNDTTYSSDISYYNFFYSIYSIRSMGIMRLSSQMHSTGRFELVPRSIWASRIEPNYFFYTNKLFINLLINFHFYTIKFFWFYLNILYD